MRTNQNQSGKSYKVFCRLTGLALLIFAGFFYRSQALRLHRIVEKKIKLDIPLSQVPMQIGNWTGEDVEIPEDIQRVAQNDDFVNRFYFNTATKQWVNLYLAYSGRPRVMIGHRPRVCYVGAGWIHQSTESVNIVSAGGVEIPCQIHRFTRPGEDRDEVVVLNFYILNGRITQSEKGFSGLGWRIPNISGDPARYVAQVQISSSLEDSVRKASVDLVDCILNYLPDKDGAARVTKHQQADALY